MMRTLSLLSLLKEARPNGYSIRCCRDYLYKVLAHRLSRPTCYRIGLLLIGNQKVIRCKMFTFTLCRVWFGPTQSKPSAIIIRGNMAKSEILVILFSGTSPLSSNSSKTNRHPPPSHDPWSLNLCVYCIINSFSFRII